MEEKVGGKKKRARGKMRGGERRGRLKLVVGEGLEPSHYCTVPVIIHVVVGVFHFIIAAKEFEVSNFHFAELRYASI